jgi:molecular chaperone GrpE
VSDEPTPSAGPGTVGDGVVDDSSAVDANVDDAAAVDDPDREPAGDGELSVENLLEDTLSDLEKVTAQRDEYLDLARRVQAEFENFRKRTEAQRVELVARAAERLVGELLPVLDACDAAIGHGAEDVAPIQSALLSVLEREGLEKIDTVDVPFDPNLHEAVLSEPGAGGEPMVVEVLRAGYSWKGRTLRAAMVKVRD